MSSMQLDIGDLINRRCFSARQWRILIPCFLIMLCDGFDIAAIGYIAPAMSRDWGVTLLKPHLNLPLFSALLSLALLIASALCFKRRVVAMGRRASA
ncbi:hypothetical protein [Chromobacterium piscinae]|uniref:hypothetical protein n=2 Tax=Chromobacterium piscinae TaxID=686831 RepID=UPI001E493DE2|nr:hypothetical protein [Chromobacterium piscinae]MCD4503265.1 hypothetical protein [Chromobacterium piscinae]MCD5327347.1 hypothetical protein [Chromobacterium piscinae]